MVASADLDCCCSSRVRFDKNDDDPATDGGCSGKEVGRESTRARAGPCEAQGGSSDAELAIALALELGTARIRRGRAGRGEEAGVDEGEAPGEVVVLSSDEWTEVSWEDEAWEHWPSTQHEGIAETLRMGAIMQ